ncbi:dihydropteroate synthase [Niveibacterium microcysteis]|uniref:dihydropteroate synthase n=1 Tax=Niveibacterium microcysteis TaxID=2811415 RepID=A0ABX7M3U1_9RHOO|nr:dihydropteroate synthase [Niveibacterium microcysteis]QSI75379.1 dihydropteroate synthase [Niveibacterium microcysteis]
MNEIRLGSYRLSVARPLVMAIINATPDSFSGDGLAGRLDALVDKAKRAIDAGAHILDVGGESSRPGSLGVSVDEELARVVPVVEALATLGCPVSVDTVKPSVMQAVIRAGASMINDINGLREPGAIDAIAESNCAVCVMHMQGQPRSMQTSPVYADVVGEVYAFLSDRFDALRQSGIDQNRIVVDPGFGFGKTLEHNLALFRALESFRAIRPVLVGVSRKTMLGQLTGFPVDQRVTASAVAAVAAAARGAAILRVHDVAETVAALNLWRELGLEANG